MNKYTISQYALLGLRKLYSTVFHSEQTVPESEMDANKASEIIYKALMAESPCMISRFGATEISSLTNFLGVTGEKKDIIKFIQGKNPEWWWNENLRFQMMNWSGFFPPTNTNLIRFGELMMECIPSIDVLGSWQSAEKHFLHYFPKANLINFVYLDPYWSNEPWTRALEGKKVLVVHPFAELIQYQYKSHREKLFKKENLLPVFDLKVVKAVQSIGGGTNEFKDWFEAFEFMKEEIDKQDYDICLIGAGAYGLPLAAHVKLMGKKAVHIGGTLQLLFGIWGKRWDNPQYVAKQLNREGAYLALKNEYWTLPNKEMRPANYKAVEDGCYW